MQRRVHLIIQGLVQGVCFRMAVQDQALREGVYGWVRNSNEGSVEVLIEGKSTAVDRMIEFCRHGPRHAVVKTIEIREEQWQGDFHEFGIRY
jgi:acylphosphatase